jgi:hypothetical protein
MGLDLENHSGSKPSADAEQFAQDEQSYDPSGPVDVSYGQPLESDINALQRDCPKGMILGIQWRNGD